MKSFFFFVGETNICKSEFDSGYDFAYYQTPNDAHKSQYEFLHPNPAYVKTELNEEAGDSYHAKVYDPRSAQEIMDAETVKDIVETLINTVVSSVRHERRLLASKSLAQKRTSLDYYQGILTTTKTLAFDALLFLDFEKRIRSERGRAETMFPRRASTRAYTCKLCKKIFISLNDLSDHEKISHTGGGLKEVFF